MIASALVTTDRVVVCCVEHVGADCCDPMDCSPCCPQCPVVTEQAPAQRVYDMSGHRELLADLAEWAHEIRTHPWEGAKPWPTSSP
ncbi:hypothetical protein [Amycolatopsis sp. CA-230715]|uniref:hypothetical protein n=1 Tax=Amycolatopsis sp. CA-230715 TaxID=2745196 RepID=UPI001C02DAE8|nr:hypothetical protein [Amycolatopsis sp. CA-230715]QWF80123.1 hypothetical protein HUW46_03541 [Amycolatopsis sp. CA-230715]